MTGPPRLATRLLRHILPRDLRDDVLGDLEAEYKTRRKHGVSATLAAARYWMHTAQCTGWCLRHRLARHRKSSSRAHRRSRMNSIGETMHTLRQDLRFALRMLGRNPLFAAGTIATIALGIGANAAIFSVLRAVLLKPFPYEEPSRLVALWNSWEEPGNVRDNRGHSVSEPELFDFRESRALAQLGAYTTQAVNITGEFDAERVKAGYMTADVFQILGVDAALGRPFSLDEDRAGVPRVAVLSHGLWQRRFGSDPGVLGRDIIVNALPRTVVGVMQPEFRLPGDYVASQSSQLWMPLRLNQDSLSGRGSHYLSAVARLGAGVTVEQANADLLAISNGLTDQGLYQAENKFHSFVVPLDEELLGDVRPALLVLYGAVGLVLLITCANVANLMLARAEGRTRELAVRTALGAGRGVLFRQLLTESLVLSIAGGAVGLALAVFGLRALIALDPSSVPRLGEVALDGTVLGYVSVISIVTGLLFGTAPALRSQRVDLQSGLKEGSRGTSGAGRHRTQRILVSAQMGLAVMLVIAATLTIRSFGNLLRLDPGFASDGVITMQVSVPSSDYPEPSDVAGFYARLLDGVRSLPGVIDAGAVRALPLAARIGDWSIQIEGRTEAPGEDFDGDWQIVTPGYLQAMRIPLREGRFFESSDRIDGHQVVVVNEAMANHYWPEGALGRRLRIGNDQSPWLEIVGIVGNVRHNGITAAINPKWYRPHEQFPASVGFAPAGMTLVLRAAGNPLSLIEPVRAQARALDPNVPVAAIQTLDDVLSGSLAQPRFTMTLLVVFGSIALLLAAVGVYAVMSHSISERTLELGLRRALGATGNSVVGMVMRQGMTVAVVGLVAGVAGALWLTTFMGSLLYEIGRRDAITFVGVPLLLFLVALAASSLPAWRAATIEPIRALRSQ